MNRRRIAPMYKTARRYSNFDAYSVTHKCEIIFRCVAFSASVDD